MAATCSSLSRSRRPVRDSLSASEALRQISAYTSHKVSPRYWRGGKRGKIRRSGCLQENTHSGTRDPPESPSTARAGCCLCCVRPNPPRGARYRTRAAHAGRGRVASVRRQHADGVGCRGSRWHPRRSRHRRHVTDAKGSSGGSAPPRNQSRGVAGPERRAASLSSPWWATESTTRLR